MNLVKIGESERRKHREVLGLASCHVGEIQVRPDDQSGYQHLIRASSLGIHSDRWNAPLC